jgi:DNA-binding response OmpR family regulator
MSTHCTALSYFTADSRYNKAMRVLIVEDDHKIAGAIKRGLTQEKFAVDVEYDGEAGFGAATTLPYDIVVLDRMLPGMDGIELCEKLRAEQIHTPILMLTAKTEVSDRVTGLNSGADDYLTKPFSFEELLARVHALLRRPKEAQSNEIQIKDLILNTLSFEVKRSGKIIQLSSKEFALLEYLMRNQGRVLSKENIIDHVWNFDADILPNNVEVYMGYLRNKIDKPFDTPLLHTVRGFGYKVSAHA